MAEQLLDGFPAQVGDGSGDMGQEGWFIAAGLGLGAQIPGQQVGGIGLDHQATGGDARHLLAQRGLEADLGDLPAVPIKLVHLNKCPVLAQDNTLRPQDADRLGINRQRCLDNLQLLRSHPQVREKAVAIFAEAEPFVPSDNVDTQLYNGFFSDADRAAMKIVLETEPRNLPALDISFVDKRIEKLLFNYRARNFPGTLDEAEQQRWLDQDRKSVV